MRRGADPDAFNESTGTTSTENIGVDSRGRCVVESVNPSGGFKKHPNRERGGGHATAHLTHDRYTLLDHYRHHPHTMIKVRLSHLPSAVALTPPQIWSMKKTEEAAAKKKPKTSAAQIRVQKGAPHLLSTPG